VGASGLPPEPRRGLRGPLGPERPREGGASLRAGRPDGQGERSSGRGSEVQTAAGGGGGGGGGGQRWGGGGGEAPASAGRLGSGPPRKRPGHGPREGELQPVGAGHRPADGAEAGPAPRLPGDGPVPHGADDQREEAAQDDGHGQQTQLSRRKR